MGWEIKKIFLLLCLMLLLPVSADAGFKGLHPPMEVEPELIAPPIEGMVYIKGGCYEMGDTFGDGNENERPVHTVCVDDFYMGKYEVTQREWVKVMGNNPSYFKGCDNCPVESVSWDDVQDFIERLNSKSGRKFRLPTEADWEYAARSGGKKERFAGFSDEGQMYLYANFCDSNCNNYKSDWKGKNQNDGYKNSSPVGSYRPNGVGLYDMTGNVWEWVSDWYGEGYYGSSPMNNPTGPLSGQYKVLRGSCFLFTPEAEGIRASHRSSNYPSFGLTGITGFRLAMSPQ